MSESIRKFYDALSKDKTMKSRAETMYTKHRDTKQGENEVAAVIVAFAKSEGFEFTMAELAEYTKAQSKELRDEELETVAGGGWDHPYDGFCPDYCPRNLCETCIMEIFNPRN